MLWEIAVYGSLEERNDINDIFYIIIMKMIDESLF